MNRQWTSCCKGRASSCPEVSLEGNLVHIKDDYGNQVIVDRSNIPFFPKAVLNDLQTQTIRIHGKEENKPPVRMSLAQFQAFLTTLEDLESGGSVPHPFSSSTQEVEEEGVEEDQQEEVGGQE